MKKDWLTSDDVRFLFNELRKASILWDGRKEVLRLARKRVFVRRAKNGNAVYKYHYQCRNCSVWSPDPSGFQVDHIEEFGGFAKFDGDWNAAIARMFPRPVEKYLQLLCLKCHSAKSGLYASARAKYKRKA